MLPYEPFRRRHHDFECVMVIGSWASHSQLAPSILMAVGIQGPHSDPVERYSHLECNAIDEPRVTVDDDEG